MRAKKAKLLRKLSNTDLKRLRANPPQYEVLKLKVKKYFDPKEMQMFDVEFATLGNRVKNNYRKVKRLSKRATRNELEFIASTLNSKKRELVVDGKTVAREV